METHKLRMHAHTYTNTIIIKICTEIKSHHKYSTIASARSHIVTHPHMLRYKCLEVSWSGSHSEKGQNVHACTHSHVHARMHEHLDIRVH